MGLLNFIKKKLVLNCAYVGTQAMSAPFDGTAWEYDTFRATVDAIATHAAKGQVRHVIINKKDGKIIETKYDSAISRLLNVKANELMSGFDFKYRFFANLETQTTAIAYVRYEMKGHKREPVAIYPVDNTGFEFKRITTGGFAIEFITYEGTRETLPLEDCVVMRKFYNIKQAGGDGNAPVYAVLDMAKASDDGFVDALEGANKIRGLLFNKKAMLDPDDVKKSQNEFAARFSDAAKHGGIVAVDSMEDFKQLNMISYSANDAQMKYIDNRIYTYLRTPEIIVQNNYNETQGQAWYEGKIEPMWESFVEAFENVIFTDTEKAYGNALIMNGGILMGTSIQTRIQVIQMTQSVPLLTRNEKRELLGYAPVEGGDVIDVTLNTVKDIDQSKYQTGKDNEEANNGEIGNGSDDPEAEN